MPTQHDRISKHVLEQALLPDGTVVLEKPVPPPHERRFDVHFVPSPERRPDSEVNPPEHLLRRMTPRECLLEIYSSTPGLETLRICVCKHFELHHDNRLRAKRARSPRPRLARLWIISPGRPAGALHRFRLKPMSGWPSGFYRSGAALGLWLVVLSELPPTRETLLLRLLGNTSLRMAAVHEIRALPTTDPLRRHLLRALSHVKFVLDRDPTAGSDEERDLMSNLLAEFERHEAEIFRRGEARGEARGEVRGEVRGKASSILAIAAGRGLLVSDTARARILGCAELATLDRWLFRALTAASVDSIFAAN